MDDDAAHRHAGAGTVVALVCLFTVILFVSMTLGADPYDREPYSDFEGTYDPATETLTVTFVDAPNGPLQTNEIVFVVENGSETVAEYYVVELNRSAADEGLFSEGESVEVPAPRGSEVQLVWRDVETDRASILDTWTAREGAD